MTKKFIFAILLVICTTTTNLYSMVCQSDTVQLRQTKGGGGDEGEDPNGTFSQVPILCIITEDETDLMFYFYDDLGYVSITIIGLDSGEISSGTLDSQLGIVDFPLLSYHSGLNRIILTTSDGQSYYGWFNIFHQPL